MNKKTIISWSIAFIIIFVTIVFAILWKPSRVPNLILLYFVGLFAIGLDDLFCKFSTTKFHSLKCIPLIRFMLALCVLGVSSLITYFINPTLSIYILEGISPLLIGFMIIRIALQPCTK